MNLQVRLVLFLFLCFYGSDCFGQNPIERIEPPFWWTGMQNPELQLLVYGSNIAALDLEVESDHARLVSVTRTSNPDYLFIDLFVASKKGKGFVDLIFSKNGKEQFTEQYLLNKRKKGSAQRKSFSSKDVLYLITPDRFANGDTDNDEVAGMKEGHNRSAEYGRHGGDIRGIINKLDYIKDLGFTAIWLNPVLENDQPKWSYHGYATTDYYKVDPRFGTNEEYIELCEKAAAKGLGVIMDIIVNHCGSEHWWMENPPFDDWINYQNATYTATNHLKTTLIDPYVSPGDRERMTHGWFVSEMPDLNQQNPFMSTYLIQNSIWWIEYAGLYGIRQDTYSYPFRDFMTDWTCAIQEEYPGFSIVGEEWVEEPAIISYWQQGKHNVDGYSSCLTSLMDFPLTFAVHRALTEEESWGKGFHRLYETLAMDFLYADPNNLVIFPDNHDMSRILTQVGEDIDKTRMALSYFLTMRGIPQIFYGTEILISNSGSESHGVIRSDYPGGWPEDKINAFTGQGLTSEQVEFRDWMKHILAWRKGNEVIHTGKLMHFAPENGIYVYFRYNDKGKIMVVLNKNEEIKTIALERFSSMLGEAESLKNIFNNEIHSTRKDLQVEGKTCLILEVE